MSRATSASLYGSRPMDDLYRVTAPVRAYGLRSESAPDGYYAGPQTPRKRTVRRASAVVSNRPDPAIVRERERMARVAARDHDNVTLIHYGSHLESAIPVIRMGDMD